MKEKHSEWFWVISTRNKITSSLTFRLIQDVKIYCRDRSIKFSNLQDWVDFRRLLLIKVKHNQYFGGGYCNILVNNLCWSNNLNSINLRLIFLAWIFVCFLDKFFLVHDITRLFLWLKSPQLSSINNISEQTLDTSKYRPYEEKILFLDWRN